MYPIPYFQMICDEIKELRRYIAFTPENTSVCGDKISELIILMGTEIDTLFKHLVGGKQPNMRTYKDWLKNHYPKITEIKYFSYIHDKWKPIFQNSNTSYSWWRAYTDLKHNRYKNLKKANLDNLHDIQAAYYVACALAMKHNPSALKQLKDTYAVICHPDIIRDKFTTHQSILKSISNRSAPGYFLDL
jgi:hypothetical protein